jgi:hypothetical protein
MSRFEVKGIDVTHASFHVEINEMFCGVCKRREIAFVSSSSEAVAYRYPEKASGGKFEKTAAIKIRICH